MPAVAAFMMISATASAAMYSNEPGRVELSGARAAPAESPQTVIQTATDQIRKIIGQYPQDPPARRQQIKAIVDGYFDFEAIARNAVGPRWRTLTSEERQTFTQEFSKLLFVNYIGDIERLAAQKITYNTRTIYQGYVVVEASVSNQNSPVSVEYHLHLQDGNWKVYNVSAGGMSLVTNYRDQFDSILANGSFDQLSMMLKRQIARVCESNLC